MKIRLMSTDSKGSTFKGNVYFPTASLWAEYSRQFKIQTRLFFLGRTNNVVVNRRAERNWRASLNQHARVQTSRHWCRLIKNKTSWDASSHLLKGVFTLFHQSAQRADVRPAPLLLTVLLLSLSTRWRRHQSCCCPSPAGTLTVGRSSRSSLASVFGRSWESWSDY